MPGLVAPVIWGSVGRVQHGKVAAHGLNLSQQVGEQIEAPKRIGA